MSSSTPHYMRQFNCGCGGTKLGGTKLAYMGAQLALHMHATTAISLSVSAAITVP